jgi:hypothetical protein
MMGTPYVEYFIQYSRAGADDWYRALGSFDDAEAAQRAIAKLKGGADYEYRIVRQTTTEEVVKA